MSRSRFWENRWKSGGLWNRLTEIKKNSPKNKCIEYLKNIETNANASKPKSIAELFVQYFLEIGSKLVRFSKKNIK